MSIVNQPTSDDQRPPAAEGGLLSKVEVAGNELTLFEGSMALVEAMVADIRQAKERVWLESYTIADDAAGRAIAEALVERAAAGVDVRVIYDAIGSLRTPQAYFDRLWAAGVQVHCFHSFRDLFWRFRLFRLLNRRDHRKLLIVDDRVGYFGGMNVVDQRGIATPEDVKLRNLPVSAGWRDWHVRLVGPQQPAIADDFERLWRWKHLKERDRRTVWRIKEMFESRLGEGDSPQFSSADHRSDGARGKMGTVPGGSRAGSGDAIHFFSSRPGRPKRRVPRIFVPLIRQARHEITLSMAYFIPVGRVLRELLRARRRGVRVRVVIPAVSDVPAVHWATRHLCRRLLARGIQIYERQDFMLHSKVMVIDRQWTVVGSCNLDPRSLWLNLEFLAVIRSSAMAAAATAFCRHEMAHSRRVRRAEIRGRSCWQRLRDRLAWSIRRWL